MVNDVETVNSAINTRPDNCVVFIKIVFYIHTEPRESVRSLPTTSL